MFYFIPFWILAVTCAVGAFIAAVNDSLSRATFYSGFAMMLGGLILFLLRQEHRIHLLEKQLHGGKGNTK